MERGGGGRGEITRFKIQRGPTHRDGTLEGTAPATPSGEQNAGTAPAPSDELLFWCSIIDEVKLQLWLCFGLRQSISGNHMFSVASCDLKHRNQIF